MVSFKLLEAFVAVADKGSFGGAATRLNTTQPNISNRIAQLEGVLSLSLFTRGGGKTMPTPKAEEILPMARATLKARDAFLMGAGSPQHLGGTLRLGVSEVVAHSWLKAFMGAFAAEHPGIEVELTVDLSRNLLAALQQSELDLCFQTELEVGRGLGSFGLGAHEMTWVAAKDVGQELSLKTLPKHRVILPAKGTQPFLHFETFCKENGVQPASIMPSTNLSASLTLVRDGLGLGYLPLALVKSDLADGKLQRLAQDWNPPPLLCSARYVEERRSLLVELALELAENAAQAYHQE